MTDTYDPCPVCHAWLLTYVGDLDGTTSAFECDACGTWTVYTFPELKPDYREVA